MNLRPLLTGAVLALAACVLAACGGGDLDEPSTLDRLTEEAQQASQARPGHAASAASAQAD
jgi:hypothetical protein